MNLQLSVEERHILKHILEREIDETSFEIRHTNHQHVPRRAQRLQAVVAGAVPANSGAGTTARRPGLA